MSFDWQHGNKLLDNTKWGMKWCFGLPNLKLRFVVNMKTLVLNGFCD